LTKRTNPTVTLIVCKGDINNNLPLQKIVLNCHTPTIHHDSVIGRKLIK